MKNGFSLVELSIVLVILGLLTGGILAGQSLIRASELRSVVTQQDRYVAAVNTFRDKYFAIPGDMSTATKFWNVAHATPATCLVTAAVGTLTCDGDGNGQVNTVSAASRETFRFWQHMANAGLIEGTYTGIAGGGGAMHHIVNTNAPGSKIGSSAGWTSVWTGTLSGDPLFFDMTVGNSLRLGASTGSSSFVTAVMKAEEAWNIDTKLDDGRPAYGKVIAIGWDECTDAATSAVITANYALTNSAISCGLMFIPNF